VVNFVGQNKLAGGDIYTADPSHSAVDFDDFDLLALHWLQSFYDDPDHWSGHGGRADIDGSGQVDFDDFDILATNWLQESDPE
jgi:hypothetical protein